MKTRIELDLTSEERLFAGIISIAREVARPFTDSDTADDVAQDVALEFLELMRASSWRGDAKTLNAFVVRRARDRALDFLKVSANREAREQDWMLHVAEGNHAWMDPDRAMEEAELAEVQRRTLEALTPACRRTFVMVRDGERSYDEVAAALGVGRSVVCKHVSEAQRQFRYELQQYGVALQQRGAPSRRRNTRTARAGARASRQSNGDRPWSGTWTVAPWTLTTLALAARSPPVLLTPHHGGTDAGKAGQHVAIAQECGGVSRATRRRTPGRDPDRRPAEAGRRHLRARDACH